MSFLKKLFKNASTLGSPEIQAIFLAAAAGDKMQSVENARAIEQTGLLGDRYSVGRGFWQVTEACQVTLISQEDLNKIKKVLPGEMHGRLEHGSHRRNLVIGNLRTRDLRGKTFRVGEAVFRYHKPRPPCGYLEKIEGKGLATAMGKNSGICITVVRGGVFAVGDRIEIIAD